ncbi:MAG: PD-(D/E)XK motif protein [Defluviicoccus sp.]|nr:PD-(D/E)XK motif protein [Defluviicoccus sp.]MDE0278007.1 PD-(D/E)XK motif protein [Defluviicoccus sp.]
MLTDLYASLSHTVPKEAGTLYGIPLSEGHSVWLSIDHNAHPALMLPSREDDMRPDIILRAVDALFSRICIVETPDGHSQSGCYSLLRLKENDPDIVRLFLTILEERFSNQWIPCDNTAIANNIQEIAALFSRVNDTTRDLIGLWGELYIIHRSDDIATAVRCWSTQKTAKYDFVTDSFVMDVKATLSASPKHRFSLEQLRPAGDFEAFVASLCLIEVRSGQTVGTLMDTIAVQIEDPELRGSFLQQCITKGGPDLYRSQLMLQPYPDDGALALYLARHIPVPRIDVSDPIDNIRFDVNLSEIAPLSDQQSEVILRFQS